ncbi:MAG: hypothetical protein LBS46_05460 [Dysgonamonadaceae bacterium]|jgi:uncharacterized membrane protein|nr:hypothetical protein [Dysgonamonadaceae bacterium]
MAEVTPTPDKDAQDNKVFAILAYFGILFLVPLFAAKESPFARYHANQGAILFILEIIACIVAFILAFVPFGWIIGYLLYLAIAVLAILGILNAVKGEKKELPLIGQFKIIK